MLKSILCNYSDGYILVKGTIIVNNTAAAGADANKNCAPVIDCISEINNTHVDNVKNIDIVMPMYNLIEYSGNYSKTSGDLWQYCRGIPAVNDNGVIVNFNGADATDSFNFKAKITGQIGANGVKEVEIMVPLKYLSNFWKTLETPLINSEINLILTWSSICVLVYTTVGS